MPFPDHSSRVRVRLLLLCWFWAKRRIETWCPTSWQSTVTARRLCKAGQYQAASGFNRSDLTCQALCFDAVSARHFCLGHD